MNDHSLRAHARFGASSAHRWFACPGSVRACEGVPDRPGAAALEGTRAHELLECSLTGRQSGSFWQTLYEQAPRDMRDAVQVAVDYVLCLLEDYPDAVMLVEHRFEIPVASAPGEVFGTNDVCVFVPSLRLLYVIDYKHGAGTFVDVNGNKQLRFYALGALASIPQDWTGKKCERCKGSGQFLNEVFDQEVACRSCGGTGEEYGPLYKIDTVAMVIIQPRVTWAEPVREEWVPVEDVLAFGKEIGEAIARCKESDAPLVPGEEQCRFCAVATTCPARERLALEMLGDSFGHVQDVTKEAMPDAGQLPLEKLGAVMAAKDAIEGWLKAVEDEARTRMLAGETVPGLKLVEAQARRQWVEENVGIAAQGLSTITHSGVGQNLQPRDFVVEKLRTLTEVEALLKVKGDRAETRRRLDAVAYLTTKKSSGALKVVADADPRPAVNRGAAAFGDVKQIPHIAN